MGARIQVILLTGFLGSGKTTLLNRLISVVPPERKLLVLVNEFGEIGIDGALVEKNTAGQGFEVIELNKGSIFCACIKADFVKTLLQIVQKTKPDLLIMEATGVANPADLRRDLALPVFQEAFEFSAQICLLDAQNFSLAYETFVSLEKQLESSTCFIINKTDLSTPEELSAIRRIVEKHRPNPLIFEAVRCAVPLEAIFGVKDLSAPIYSAPARPAEDVQNLMRQISLDPLREMAPPDRLLSAVLEGQIPPLQNLAAFLQSLPHEVVRGKGFFRYEQGVFLAELVMGNASLSEVNVTVAPELLNKLVCIFLPEFKEKIEAAAKIWGMRLTGVTSPAMSMHS